MPQPWVGSLQAAHVPGKGRGLIASAPISPGDLLLVCSPIVSITNQAGDPEIPDVQQLLNRFESCELNDEQLRWVRLLAAPAGPEGQVEAINAQDFLKSDPSEQLKGILSDSPRRHLTEDDVPKYARLGLLDHNMYGGESADVIMSTARGEEL
eukprot:CAMPEP_0202384178 /NCGR_PEP_ID=MMETSP1127-20130417/53808_1 /ASSEMBLY_ACC=CAM_ASM_000462 /TAXON_ID=3047 /ORGANISM="Dunaliella tertiolecta, Strain CCMP1320" /LENGTH=152 /DNA_ID=CAMNT_0048983907 /DNA_START=116 /DNA_END=570 /DNA_ORIENTATION=+